MDYYDAADITPRQASFANIDHFSSDSDPYSSPSPPTTNTSYSMSPASIHEQLPKQDLTLVSSEQRQQRHQRPNPPRKGDPAYIPRPENAFILFRKDAVQKIRIANAEPPPGPGKSEKGKRQRQADMSKSISQLWKALSKEERSVWEEKAARIKREHEAKHPEYRYQPSRPGSSVLRKGAAAKRAPSSRRKQQEWEEEEFSTDLSEDSTQFQSTRSLRRPSTSSVSSTSSSVSQRMIALPSLDPFAAAELASTELSRVSGSSRQWVQPPLEDPSPPPNQLFFPRGGNLQPSLMPRDEPMTRRPQQPSRLHISQVPAPEESDDIAPIFVEPITSERNPWSPGSSRLPRMPPTPRRASIRAATRARSNSVPHLHSLRHTAAQSIVEPVSPTQMSEPEIESPAFQLDLPWSPDHSLNQMQHLELIGSPEDSFSTSPTSSQDTDFGSLGGDFGLTVEELSELWRVTGQSDTFDFNDYCLIEPSFFLPPREEDTQSQTSDSLVSSTSGFPYQLDLNGRRGSSFF